MVLVAVFVFWYAMTTPGLIPDMFETIAGGVLLGEPIKIFARIGPGSLPTATFTRICG